MTYAAIEYHTGTAPCFSPTSPCGHKRTSFCAMPQLFLLIRTPYCHDPAAQPGIAVDRFARKIAGILKAVLGALAATECQAVGLPSAYAISKHLILEAAISEASSTRVLAARVPAI